MTSTTTLPTRSVSLLLRLWTKADAGSGDSLRTWNDGNPLMQMLRHVVTFGGGVPNEVGSEGSLLCAHYLDEFRAARTARQIQALITGFAGVDGRQMVAASIAIVEGTATLPDEKGHLASLRAYLEQRAQPAQILFASLNQKDSALATVFKAQAVAAFGPAQQRFQLYELLWSYKDQAVAAAVRAHSQMLTPQEGAAEKDRTGPAERGSLVNREMPSWLRSMRVTVTIAAEHATATASRLAESVIPNRRLRFIAAGALAVLVVGTVFLLHHRSAPAAKLSATHATGAGTPPTGVTTGTTVSPPKSVVVGRDVVPLPVPKYVGVPGEGNSTAEKDSATRRTKPSKAPQPGEEPERASRPRGEFSAEETRQILNRGQAELDRGCYEKAIGYYRRVIEDDPLNATASSGIDKARRRMQLDPETKAGCR